MCRELHQLRKVHALRPQAQHNGILIRLEPVRGDLEASLGGRRQFLREGNRIAFGAAPQVPSQNHLAMSLDGNECPGISERDIILALFGLRLFLHADESPHLITLHFFDPQPVDAVFHQPLTSLASEGEKIQDRAGMHASYSGIGPHRATLDQVL